MTPSGFPRQDGGSIYLALGDGVSASVTSGAASQWNSNCNNASGSKFPAVTQVGQGHIDRIFTVTSHPGFNPNNNGACAQTNAGNGTIDLYSQFMALGNQYGCGDTTVMALTLAHEIGHILGLTTPARSNSAANTSWRP